MVHRSRVVDLLQYFVRSRARSRASTRISHLLGQRSGGVSGLRTLEDVKVVVCSMATCVSFGANGRAKDDEVPRVNTTLILVRAREFH
jgi:hypothetical protein